MQNFVFSTSVHSLTKVYRASFLLVAGFDRCPPASAGQLLLSVRAAAAVWCTCRRAECSGEKMNLTDLSTVIGGNLPFSRATMDSLLYRDASKQVKLVRSSFSNVDNIYKRRHTALERAVNASGGVARASELLKTACSRGLQCSALGVDVSRMRPTGASASLLEDVEVLAALRLLLFEERMPNHADASSLAQRLWEADQPAREAEWAPAHQGVGTAAAAPPFVATVSNTYAPRDERTPLPGQRRGQGARTEYAIDANGMRESLRRDGFAKVADWASFGLESAALREQAAVVLAGARFSNGSTVRRAYGELPALRSLLSHEGLANAIHGYLGGTRLYPCAPRNSKGNLKSSTTTAVLGARLCARPVCVCSCAACRLVALWLPRPHTLPTPPTPHTAHTAHHNCNTPHAP